jgi:AcrR family transcriptional regulator
METTPLEAQSQTTELYRELAGGGTARFDRKRIELLTQAAQVFAEHGYERTSMRQVAQATHSSLAGLYHYVSCKEQLLFFIQFHTFGVLVEALEAALVEPRAAEAQLRAMVSSHVRYLAEHLPELKLCTTELETLEGSYYERVLERRQRYFELTRQILRRLADEGGGARVDPNLAALYLFGMLNWIVMWFDPQRNDPGELARSQVELFLDGFRPRG